MSSYIAVSSSKVVLSKAKMQHILQSHHPSYWIGAKGKSMFDPSLNVNNIKNIVNSVVRMGKNGYVQSAYPVR